MPGYREIRMLKVCSLKSLLVVLITILSRSAFAYEFIPTDAEWQSWPGHCQAKYVWTPIGESWKFKNSVGPLQRSELARLQEGGIIAVHHLCAGKLWIQRARLESSPTQKKWMYLQAWDESMFTANRSDRESPLYSDITLTQATILFEQGDAKEAIRLLQERTGEDPTSDVLYSAAAVMQRKMGNLEEARATLLRGDEATSGKSAEINYNLGLVSLELDNVEDAKRYAENAYRLGYPLPGLKFKLARLDRR